MADADAKNTKPALTHAERIFVRINVAQTVLAVAGLFTGAVALYAALSESEAVRRQSAAAVWPFVQVLTWDSLEPDSKFFRISMTNAGAGPARIETVRIKLEGRTVLNWADALAGFSDAPQPRFSQMATVGRVLRPGDSIDMMSTVEPDLVERLHEIVLSETGSIEYCYCSIFDECWLANISAVQMSKPIQVRKCPDFGSEKFQN